jgi:hypothetical protein
MGLVEGDDQMANYTVSEICDPIITARNRSGSSLFRERVLSIPVGKAVVVEGMHRGNVASRARQIGLQQVPQRQFSTSDLGNGRTQITRKF